MYNLKMLFGLLLTGGFLLCSAQDCNRDALRKCRETAVSILERTNGGITKKTLEMQCGIARDSLNCMLYQTSVCSNYEEQNNKSEIIVKTWRYLASVCDSFVDWWTNPCFQRDGVKRCETMLGSSRSVDSTSCREYIGFRECINTVIKRCKEEDSVLLGVYLLEKGQEKAWRCPQYTDLSLIPSEPLAADSPFTGPACVAGLTKELKKCKEPFQKIQQEALPEDSNEKREKMLCCATFAMKDCAIDLAKEKCGVDKSDLASILDSILPSIMTCKERSSYDCSGVGRLPLMNGWLIAFISLALIYMKN